MIDIRKLKELVRLMVANDLSEIDLRDSEEQVTIHRPTASSVPQVTQVPVAAPAVAAVPAASSVPATAAVPEVDDTAGLVPIQSPMVGTYYSAASPDADPFAKVGDTISEGDVVCLIEAMKIFNEIKAEASGKIQKVLVSNGDPVEFGQDILLIKPA